MHSHIFFKKSQFQIFLFSTDDLNTGCRGYSSLCDSDATVVCQKIGNATLICECVYVTGLEDLPLCESTESNVPLCESTESNGKVISKLKE